MRKWMAAALAANGLRCRKESLLKFRKMENPLLAEQKRQTAREARISI